MKRGNVCGKVLAMIVLLFAAVTSCTPHVESMGPSASSCEELAGQEICKDDIIARCVDGELQFEYCFAYDAHCEGVESGGLVCARGPGQASLIVGKIEVTGDDNNDGSINRGEQISLTIALRNIGSLPAEDVYASLHTDDPYVSAAGGSSYYGRIESGAEGSHLVSHRFVVSESCPASRTVTFNLEIVDGDGNQWNREVRLEVVPSGANIALGLVSIIADDNMDGVANKGETVSIKVELKNVGTAVADSVYGGLSTKDPYASVSSASAYYGTIKPGGAEEPSSTFFLTIGSDCPAGHEIPMMLRWEDAQGNSGTLALKLKVSAVASNLVLGVVQVTSDSNGDGKLNKGESASLAISTKNTGASSALGVYGILFSNDPYIETNGASVYFGDVKPGAVKGGSQAFLLSIDEACPAGHVAQVSLKLEDSNQNESIIYFQITVVAHSGLLVAGPISIVSDTNNNGFANPGETLSIRVSLKNSGTSTVKSVYGFLGSSDSCVAYTSGNVYYGDIKSGATVKPSTLFNFALTQSCPLGHTLSLSVYATDEQENEWIVPLSLSVQ